MATLTDGLFVYEIVLAVLGSLLFLLLIPLLWRQVWQGRPYRGLLAFFLLPVGMIGFPGLESIKYEKGILTLARATSQLEQDPDDPDARQVVEQQVVEATNRPTTNPEAKIQIARAQFALGEHAVAEATVDQALQAQPASPAARDLKDRILFDRTLSELAVKVEQDPTDAPARQQLQAAVLEAVEQSVASPTMLVNIAAGAVALGRTEEAAVFNKRALTFNPNLQSAITLQQKLDAGDQ